MHTMVVQLFAVTSEGPVELPVPAGVESAHQLFDRLPLGVYSALRTWDHERFLGLGLHFDRLQRSMELVGWDERLDRDTLARALDECVRAYPGTDAFVRFDRLPPAPGLPVVHGREERTLIALSPYVPVPARLLTEGVTVRISPLVRAQPLVKVASFVVERRPFPLGRQEAYEHLLLDADGRILEGSSSNFVALRGRTLHLTGEAALQGVTQRIVGALARELGLASVHAPVSRADLGAVDEAFLTGSTRGIVPVVAVEEQGIGTGQPGEWTLRLLAEYREHARRNARRAIEASPAG
jgi:branched-chain amino acid aminotransferase